MGAPLGTRVPRGLMPCVTVPHRAVTTDLRRGGVVFNNEHFAVTYVERGANEPIPERQERGTRAHDHTHSTRGTHIAYRRAAIAEAAAYVQSFLQERWEEEQQQQLAQAKGEKAQSKSGAKTEVSRATVAAVVAAVVVTTRSFWAMTCRPRRSSLS